MTTEKLKPCPICGSTDLYIGQWTDYSVFGNDTYSGKIECRQCDSRDNSVKVAVSLPSRLTVTQDLCRTWNHRPLEDALEARVKELEAELAQARAAAEKLAQNFVGYESSLECSFCEKYLDVCELCGPEEQKKALLRWAYAPQEEEE